MVEYVGIKCFHNPYKIKYRLSISEVILFFNQITSYFHGENESPVPPPLNLTSAIHHLETPWQKYNGNLKKRKD